MGRDALDGRAGRVHRVDREGEAGSRMPAADPGGGRRRRSATDLGARNGLDTLSHGPCPAARCPQEPDRLHLGLERRDRRPDREQLEVTEQLRRNRPERREPAAGRGQQVVRSTTSSTRRASSASGAPTRWRMKNCMAAHGPTRRGTYQLATLRHHGRLEVAVGQEGRRRGDHVVALVDEAEAAAGADGGAVHGGDGRSPSIRRTSPSSAGLGDRRASRPP